jgi:hypothetical protein
MNWDNKQMQKECLIKKWIRIFGFSNGKWLIVNLGIRLVLELKLLLRWLPFLLNMLGWNFEKFGRFEDFLIFNIYNLSSIIIKLAMWTFKIILSIKKSFNNNGQIKLQLSLNFNIFKSQIIKSWNELNLTQTNSSQKRQTAAKNRKGMWRANF